jgi:thioredoxin 1
MKPVTITSDNFEANVVKSGKPAMLDFWAVWCGPCKAIAPVVEDLAKEYDGKLVVGKVDVDANNEISVKYGVRAIPTLIFFKNGQEVDRIVGNTQKQQILQRINNLF